MAEKKIFHFEFEDDSAAETGRRDDRITLEYSNADDERLRIEIIGGVPFVFGNHSGLLTLAKVLIKFALSKYKDGFHIHLHQDFNADSPEVLGVGVTNGLN